MSIRTWVAVAVVVFAIIAYKHKMSEEQPKATVAEHAVYEDDMPEKLRAAYEAAVANGDTKTSDWLEKLRAVYEKALAKGDTKTMAWVKATFEAGYEGACVVFTYKGRVIMFVNSKEDNKVKDMQEYKDGLVDAYTVEFAAGKVEKGEKDPKVTAIRECEEEVGGSPNPDHMVLLGIIEGGTCGASYVFGYEASEQEVIKILAHVKNVKNELAPFKDVVFTNDPLAPIVEGHMVRNYVRKYVMPAIGAKLMAFMMQGLSDGPFEF